MMIHAGHDPNVPVSVSPATHPGERAIIQQPLRMRKDAAGNLVYTYLAERVEAATFEQSNMAAIAKAEQLNNGMKVPHDTTDAEHDDG